MSKVLGFTYAPKIPAVLDGRCTQTIRYWRRIAPLEELLLHGWAGRPYLAPWSWRMRVICTEAIPITVTPDGISTSLCTRVVNRWDTPWMDELAKRDFIDPPTGVELGNVLTHLHKIGEEGEPFQIIRWKAIQ